MSSRCLRICRTFTRPEINDPRALLQQHVQAGVPQHVYFAGPDERMVVAFALLFYVHGEHLRSCRDGQLTLPHFSWAGLDLLSG